MGPGVAASLGVPEWIDWEGENCEVPPGLLLNLVGGSPGWGINPNPYLCFKADGIFKKS